MARTHQDSSSVVVLAALAGNLAIATTKFIAFLFTRSTAMLTESIHSLVDTGDEVLLLIGQARARTPPDPTHPFGYGMETYFWSFIVALMVFFAGGVVSIWEGVQRVLRPEPLSNVWVSYLVLAISAVFEGASFLVGYRAYHRLLRQVHAPDMPVWRFVRISKDPNLFATLLEDSAALTGLAIAALGVTASVLLGWEWADAAASVLIGLLLLCVAVFLGNETRSLIAGEAAVPLLVDNVRRIVEADPRVEKLFDLSSLQLGPQEILIAMTLRFRSGLSGDEVQAAAEELGDQVQASDPRICKVFLRPGDGASPDLSAI